MKTFCMNFEQNKIELFDLYLLNELAGKERVDFESQLQSDPRFKDEFEAYQKAVQLVKLMGVREELGRVIDANQKPKYVITQWYLWLPMAASIIFLMIYFWPQSTQTVSDRDLFLAYYHPYPNVITTRSYGNELTEALELYTRRNYKRAGKLFATISPETDTTLFYQGLSYLSRNLPDSSLMYFSNIDSVSVFRQQVIWYTAMCYLAKKDRLNTTTSLEMVEIGNFNFEEAQKILKEIKVNK